MYVKSHHKSYLCAVPFRQPVLCSLKYQICQLTIIRFPFKSCLFVAEWVLNVSLQIVIITKLQPLQLPLLSKQLHSMKFYCNKTLYIVWCRNLAKLRGLWSALRKLVESWQSISSDFSFLCFIIKVNENYIKIKLEFNDSLPQICCI